MLPNRSAAYENAPLDDLLSILLRQFRRPLASRQIEFSDADAVQIAKLIVERGELTPQAVAIRDALGELVAESEMLLSGWGLTFEHSLDTPMDRVPGWETTGEFLEIANEKSNAELRISTGSILLAALGDLKRLDHLRFLAKKSRDAAEIDLDNVLARRVLLFLGVDPPHSSP